MPIDACNKENNLFSFDLTNGNLSLLSSCRLFEIFDHLRPLLLSVNWVGDSSMKHGSLLCETFFKMCKK